MHNLKHLLPRRLLHGADYNYEQWLDFPAILAEDFRLMQAAHCNVMSIGIFAWAMLEPAEGQFQFGWLDRLMDTLAEHGISAILATPSGARPAWLSARYPEVCRVDAFGRREPHRFRHNHCRTSPVYREKCRLINTRLAERYREHPALVLWHVSNEYNAGACHCDLCYAAFRQWLQARYGTLEALNQAWWTTFWSHRYTAWQQIAPVDDSIHGLMLDWQRFLSDQTLDFFRAESEPLRQITPRVPVTTNFMRPDVGLDYWQFAHYVDIVAWDSYPPWHSGDDVQTALQTAFYHDLHRSYKHGQPFLLMESTPSVTNWQGTSRPKRPGMHALASLQAVAHGADSVQYFQWRQSRGSSEKFHGAVVGHAGHAKTRIFREVAALGETLAGLAGVAQTHISAQVALVYDFHNEWALNLAQLPGSRAKNYQRECLRHYEAFWRRGIAVDLVDMSREVGAYRLVVAPLLYMLRAGFAERLAAFVQAGGTLVGTYLTGLVDEHDLCFLADAPGPLQEVFGLWCAEQDVLHETQAGSVAADEHNGLGLSGVYAVRHYADVLHLATARALATYRSEFYRGTPALTVNPYGNGQAYYMAARLDDRFHEDFYGGLARQLGLKAGWGAELPAGVSVQVRQAADCDYVFVMNFNAAERAVSLDSERFTDALTGAQCTGTLTLPGYGVRVLNRLRPAD